MRAPDYMSLEGQLNELGSARPNKDGVYGWTTVTIRSVYYMG